MCILFFTVFWSVHPHSSYHDCCQEKDGGDAPAAQSQWNQVSSHQQHHLVIVSFFIYLTALLEKSIKKCYWKYIYPQKSCNCMNSNSFLSSAWRWTQTQGQLTSVRQKTACISGWPCWPRFWADRCMCCGWEAAAHTAAAHAILLWSDLCYTTSTGNFPPWIRYCFLHFDKNLLDVLFWPMRLLVVGDVGKYPVSNQYLQKLTNISVDFGFGVLAVSDLGFIFLKTRFHVSVSECGGNIIKKWKAFPVVSSCPAAAVYVLNCLFFLKVRNNWRKYAHANICPEGIKKTLFV